MDEAAERGHALSVARLTFEAPLDRRASLDGARLLNRLTRDTDFAYRENDGAIIVAFTQTDLRSAHVVARRIASVLRRTMITPEQPAKLTAHITLGTLKAGDTVESLMRRVVGSEAVAAE